MNFLLMDEILLHISQRLEDLQVLLSSTAHSSRAALQSYSDQLASLSVRCRRLLNECAHNLNAVVLRMHATATSFSEWTWSRVGPSLSAGHAQLMAIVQWLTQLCMAACQAVNHRAALVRIALTDGSLAAMLPRSPALIGSLGFALGSVVGLGLGLNWQARALPPAVCMKAVVASNLRGLDAVSLVEDQGRPQISRPDEVLVEVVASSIDAMDIAICGGYATSLRRHLGVTPERVVLGRDCAGVVVEVGRDVKRLCRGDEVWLALSPWQQGAMAQLVVAKQSQVALKPSNVSFEAAATLPLAALQACNAALHQARLGENSASGKRVLVRDACSAVGCVLVQLTRSWGAHVTAVVSARGKQVARQIGAHDVIVASIDLDMELRSRPRYDVVFNTIGSAVEAGCRRACDSDGVVVNTAMPNLPADNYGLLVSCCHTLWVKAKCLLRGGHTRVIYADWRPVLEGSEVLNQVTTLVQQGQLQPVLDRVFAAPDVELALQHVTSGNAVGKTVLHFRSLGRGNFTGAS